MAAGMGQLTRDLEDETAELRALLAGLEPAKWEVATPAEGWAVRDQVSHLAYFDDAAVRAATEPAAFTEEVTRLLAEAEISPDDIAARYRNLPAGELLAWFDRARARLLTVFAGLDAKQRVPWYGPSMSATSMVTARLMETWAHGQDVADALGVSRAATTRLRHVAHLGVRTMSFSFQLHGRPVPDAPVRVELTGPTGDRWEWGPADAGNRVVGPALDFCLLVTQRRHRDDLALEITGPVATEWMSIAQAFAGAPGKGRAPLR